jgi:hypothetical protein
MALHRFRDRGTSVRDEIPRAPSGDRLDLALDALDEVFGTRDEVNALRVALGLTPLEARLVAALNRSAPNVVSKGALHRAMYPAGYDMPEMKIVDVLVCKIRAKGVAVVTDRGVGYRLVDRIDAEAVAPAAEKELAALHRHPGGWSAQDDADLVRMFRRGDSLTVIAEEVGRSECAIRARMRRLFGREPKAAPVGAVTP